MSQETLSNSRPTCHSIVVIKPLSECKVVREKTQRTSEQLFHHSTKTQSYTTLVKTKPKKPIKNNLRQLKIDLDGLYNKITVVNVPITDKMIQYTLVCNGNNLMNGKRMGNDVVFDLSKRVIEKKNGILASFINISLQNFNTDEIKTQLDETGIHVNHYLKIDRIVDLTIRLSDMNSAKDEYHVKFDGIFKKNGKWITGEINKTLCINEKLIPECGIIREIEFYNKEPFWVKLIVNGISHGPFYSDIDNNCLYSGDMTIKIRFVDWIALSGEQNIHLSKDMNENSINMSFVNMGMVSNSDNVTYSTFKYKTCHDDVCVSVFAN